jgi:predicted phosphate transport protein (TIGR00153 family)
MIAMLGRFMPREVKFFDLFNAHAKEIVRGADALVALMAALNRQQEEAVAHAEAIDAIESRADKITHETVSLLHSTFITPLDRDEIHKLISTMDDVLDTIQDAAQTVAMYDIRRATPEAIKLAEIIRACAEKVSHAVGLLADMDNGPAILEAARVLDRLEDEADVVLRQAMSRLFREESDTRELIKLKAIYELLETVTDHCDDVGNLLEAIVLENS